MGVVIRFDIEIVHYAALTFPLICIIYTQTELDIKTFFLNQSSFHFTQEELEIKTKNEDYKMLRSITKETITSDLELIELGLELGLPNAVMKQKLHDYPRCIETASYMLAAEWWDSSCNSSQEKCRALLNAVHSMGKKCTAQRLENVVQENQVLITNRIPGRISTSHGRDQNHLANSASHGAIGSSTEGSGLEGNRHNPAICENVADSTGTNGNRGNLAICGAADVAGQDGSNRNGGVGAVGPDRNNSDEGAEDHYGNINIVEITYEQEGNQEQAIERESYEIEYASSEQNRSVQNEVVDIFEASDAITSSNEIEKTRRSIDISQLNQAEIIAPNIKNTSSNGTSNDDLDVFDHIETESSFRLTAENLDDFGEETGSNRGRGIKNSQQLPVHRDVWVDIFENEDTTDSKETLLRRISTRHERDSASSGSDNEEEDLNISISPQSRLLRSHGNSSINDQDVVYPLLPEVHIINTPSHGLTSEKSPIHGQTGEMNTSLMDSQADFLSCQRRVMDSQTGVANSQDSRKSAVKNQTGVMKDQTGVANGQIEVLNNLTVSVDGQMVVANSQTGIVNGQTDVVNEKTGRMNGQTEIQNGQTGIVNGQADVDYKQAGTVKGQKGMVGCQRSTLNKDIIEENRGLGKSRSKGFLHRLFRLFRRKRTNVNGKDEELAIATSGETEL